MAKTNARNSVQSSGTLLPTSSAGTMPSSGQGSQAASDTTASMGPLKTPFVAPLPDVVPPPAPQLTAQQQAKYQALLSTVSEWTTVPTTAANGAEHAPITDEERMWLTRECLLRYLRATKWNAVEAPKRLLATLTWRREYGLQNHTADYISPENETGKQIILGYDIAARPCMYLRPSQQNTQRSERQIQHLVFMLERAIDLMVPGQESLTLLCNFKDSGSGSNPSVGQGRQTLTILQGHYPERLGRALITNVPWAVWGFFKLITPFIDPLTREKMKFNEDLRLHIPPSQLWSIQGGDVSFEYDHSVYWPTLVQTAKERRAALVERWIKAGKHIGESEVYLKGGNERSVGDQEKTAEAAAAETVAVRENIPANEKSAVDGNGSVTAPESAKSVDVPSSASNPATEPTMPQISELKV